MKKDTSSKKPRIWSSVGFGVPRFESPSTRGLFALAVRETERVLLSLRFQRVLARFKAHTYVFQPYSPWASIEMSEP